MSPTPSLPRLPAWRSPSVFCSFRSAAHPERRARVLDGVVILATVMLPMVMLSVPDVAGAAQRTVVAVGYLWYVVEAIQVTRIRRPRTHTVG